MLHQTFPLFLPKFNHFSSSSATTTNPSPSPPPPTTTSSSQVKAEEMECVEAKALKTSCWPEMGLKSVQQVLSEELILGGGNGISNCVHDSFVDDLLDFPKEEVEEEDDGDDKFIEEEEKDSVSASSHEQNSNCSSDVTAKDEFGSVPGSELCVPADDLADLEWLSHFVEDSFTEFSFPYPSVTPTEKTQTPIPNINTNRSQLPVCSGIPFPSPVPAKARSKRSRTNGGGRVWSLGSPSFSESTITTTTTTTSSSSSYSSSPSSSSSNSCLIFTNPSTQNLDLFYYPPSSKKQKKKQKSQTETTTQNQRRCSHCGVQKTPQWRTGPLGAKTLCNACGVRFKSGRLLPEYRPACSPTFSSEVHSNNHRKVLEMRRKKDTSVPDSGPLSPAVHSF